MYISWKTIHVKNLKTKTNTKIYQDDPWENPW